MNNPVPPSAAPARPRRADAERNRKALVAAARRVFERDGYVAARVTDIAEEAGVAHGSFYSHFRDKDDALAAVLAEVGEEMLHPGPALPSAGAGPAGHVDHADPVAVIEAANLAYLLAYQRNARLMALLEQVATVDKDFLELRLQRSAAFLARNARAIRRFQRAGLADPGLDADLASLALSTMISRSAYVAFAIGRGDIDVHQLAAAITRLWVNGLRLPALPSKRGNQRKAAEVTEQISVAGSEGTDEGVSEAAAAETDATDVVEAAGRFRIYLGAAAGVGKTYAMLNEGQRRRKRGADVVIGYVECHGRRLTEEVIDGLEVVPRKVVEYRGSRLEEMDLDAVLRRRPKIALVDELAHTNVPGSGPNEKRWQDVLEILAAGINVITTVNIQHLESIAGEVEHMTGAKVRERVPDWVVRKADQIELVDSSPEQLRRRMIHGNIYPKERVPQALTHFFRTDNLIALRELALRFLADQTDEELLEYLRQHQSQVVWETNERIMVAVTAEPGTDALLRRAARMASRLKGELDAVHVSASDASRREDSRAIDRLRELAADLGARWHEIEEDDPARALVSFARKHQVTQIVIGASQRSWWQHLTSGGSHVLRVIREAGAFGIDVHVIARREEPPAKTTKTSAPSAAREP